MATRNPVAKPEGDNVAHLIAFNEMQHQLYNYLTHTKDDWSISDFLDALYEKAEASGIAGDFGWAVKWSLRGIMN